MRETGSRGTRRFVAALLAGALAAVAGCGGVTKEPANVVIITTDTTRRDSVEPYGGERIHTPTIRGLAEEGVVFESAFCPMPVTRPSHASLFTGRYPRSHGVLNNTYALTERWPTLAELLRARGYDTYGVVSTGLLNAESGFARGFGRFRNKGPGLPDARETIDASLEFLDDAARNTAPFFLWVHLFDPHFPYAPHADGTARGGDGPYATLAAASHATLAELAAETGGDITAPMLERIHELYEEEVAYMDGEIGRLVKRIDSLGLAGRTLVVVVADHGESFDHNFYFNHDRVLYESTVAVPWIFRWPGTLRPGRVPDVVETVDCAPTILDLLGLPAQEAMQGRSVTPLLRGERVRETPAFFSLPAELAEDVSEAARRIVARRESRPTFETVLGEVPIRDLPPEAEDGVFAGGWKLILRGGEPFELYHVADDPREERNRLGENPDEARELLGMYRDWVARTPVVETKPDEATDEMVDRLRSLGYVE